MSSFILSHGYNIIKEPGKIAQILRFDLQNKLQRLLKSYLPMRKEPWQIIFNNCTVAIADANDHILGMTTRDQLTCTLNCRDKWGYYNVDTV